MNALRSTPTVVSLFAASAALAASCASQGDEPAVLRIDDAGSPDTSAVVTGPDAAALDACTDGRWCAVTLPVPMPLSLNGIWGSGPKDVWIVASPDRAIHWNGVEFTSTRLDTNQTLFGIWGGGPADVWAFSTGNALWHNAGGDPIHDAWSAFDEDAGGEPPAWVGPIFGMSGRSANDVWAVGPSFMGAPTVWHSDGWNGGAPSWTSTTTTPGANPWDPEPSFHAVWSSAAGEVWVVGERGKTRYSSGWQNGAATWTVVDSGTSLSLHAVWGDGKGEVWAAGAAGAVRRFTKQSDGTIAVQDVPFPNGATLRALFGFAANDIWAGGTDGTLAHWDGAAWSLVELGGAASDSDELFAIWASGPQDVWAVGRNTLLHKGTTLLPGTTP